MLEPEFARSLFACDDASSLRLKNGNRFIRKLPDDRSLGYLHKLFSPLDNAAIVRISEGIGRQLPREFESFLRWSNGANLFDNHLYVFGSVERISRSTDLEKQQPISIANSNLGFSGAEHGRWHRGWVRIGAVVGWSSSYDIELHEGGACSLSSEKGNLSVPSFGQCMVAIIDRIGGRFSCNGIIDHSYAEIEAALASLIQRQ